MPYFGAHMSIAGGLYKSVESASLLGIETLQLFTHSPSQWAVKPSPTADWVSKPLLEDDVAAFKKWLRDKKLRFPTAHDSYLINLATSDEMLNRKSIEAFVGELERAELLGLTYLVTHPGAHVGSGEEAGIARVAAAIDETHRRCLGFKTMILLEATAGQGTTLGHRFEHLAGIIERVAEPKRLGVCIDTCHIFAAGYELATRKKYEATIDEFDRIVGIRKLKLFHLNDSLKPLGSRVDRHAHLGKGHLGLEPFRFIVNDPRFEKLPMILETPKETPDNDCMDAVNLAVLRELQEPRRKSGKMLK